MSAITALNSSAWFRESIRQMATVAIKLGRIKRQNCACGNPKAMAHHDDYAKPFAILWKCGRCHSLRHKCLGWGYKGRSEFGHPDRMPFDTLTIKQRTAAFTVLCGSACGFRKSFSILSAKPKALATFETQGVTK